MIGLQSSVLPVHATRWMKSELDRSIILWLVLGRNRLMDLPRSSSYPLLPSCCCCWWLHLGEDRQSACYSDRPTGLTHPRYRKWKRRWSECWRKHVMIVAVRLMTPRFAGWKIKQSTALRQDVLIHNIINDSQKWQKIMYCGVNKPGACCAHRWRHDCKHARLKNMLTLTYFFHQLKALFLVCECCWVRDVPNALL